MFHQTLRLFVVLAACAAIVGCGGKEDPQPSQDLGSDVEQDMGEADVAVDASAEDVGEDAAPDMNQPPVDTDGDGVLDDGDNCVDAANPEQLDRDRDGIGDACDGLPFYNDPANPGSVTGTRENEEELSNDSATDGLEYELTLPFVARGIVDPIDANDIADLDFYSFEVDEPTAIIVHLQSSQTMWGAAIVLGMDLANQSVFRATIATDLGTETVREVFLPYPGRYTLVTSDARNLIQTQTDVGGAGLQYAVSVSELPLPEPKVVSLPMTAETTPDEGSLKVYEVAADGLDGLRATSTGAAGDANSFVFPIVALFDPDQNRTLAMNALAQTSETQSGTLTINLAAHDRIWMIEDVAQQAGSTTTSARMERVPAQSESESLSSPADSREQDLPWMEVGTTMDGAIGQPRATGGDEDFFLFTVQRGQTIKVTVEPLPNSPLQPLLQLTHYSDQLGFPYAFHEASAPEVAGEPASVEYVMTAYMDGEVAAYVQHYPNAYTSPDVGGGSYSYTIKVEEVSPATQNFASLPASGDFEFEPGGLAIAEFTGTPGQFVTVATESGIIPALRVIDTSTWQLVTSSSSSITVGTASTGPYWVEATDLIGRGTGTTPLTMQLNAVTAQALPSLPATASGVLDTAPLALHTVQATTGEILDLRVYAPNFFAAIQVYNGQLEPVGGRFYQERQLVVPADGVYTIAVTPSTGRIDPLYSYTLGVSRVVPDPRAVPFTENGALDATATADWFRFPVTMGTLYSTSVTAPDPGFVERVRFYDENLTSLRTTVSGKMRWLASYTGDVWMVVEDDANAGSAALTYTATVRELTPVFLGVGQSQSYTLTDSLQENLHDFALAGPSAIDVTVTPVGTWRPEIVLTTGENHDALTEVSSPTGRLRYAVSAAGDFGVSVRSRDASAIGPLQYSIRLDVRPASSATNETEPNNTAADAQTIALPASISGGITGADVDRFRVNAVRGQRVWALVADRNGFGTSRYDARLRVFNALGTQLTENSYSGEGFLPAIYGWQAGATGEYQVEFGPRPGGNADGDYSLYLMLGPSADATEAEPNDSITQAQSLGTFVGPTRVVTTVDGTDPIDVYQIAVPVDGTVRVSLENANPNHELRLLNGAGTQVAASGPSHDGSASPQLVAANLPAGAYYVEFTPGTGGGQADLIIIVE